MKVSANKNGIKSPDTKKNIRTNHADKNQQTYVELSVIPKYASGL